MNASIAPNDPQFSEELAAALEWWRSAGVDSDFTDDATAWFQSEDHESEQTADPRTRIDANVRQRSSVPHETEPAKNDSLRIDLLGPNPPQSLEEFHDFWLTTPGLDAIGPRGRVPPRGPKGADLMILVVDPEEVDRDTLLSGPQGALLSSIISATGIDRARVYFGSALPRHTPVADISTIAAGGMDRVVAHHISLVQPKALIAFGAGLNPLLNQFVSQSDTGLPVINHFTKPEINQTLALPPTLMSEGLDALLNMPRLKSRFWRRWIEWSAKP